MTAPLPGPPPVALIDDDDDLRIATTQLLELAGYAVTAFADPRAALAAIDADFPGAVVTDVRMPHVSGIELFRMLRARDAELPVILITGHGDVAMAVDALQAGAWDFLTKPFAGDALLAALQRATRARALALDNRRLRAAAASDEGDGLLGESPEIRRLRAMVPTLAAATLDLVIEGDTGTGKELFARLLHRSGPRARHRFQSVDCASMPVIIAERDLLARNGIVAGANRGTLFLDNLHLADHDLQHRLARLVEVRAVALDRTDPDPVNLRIIATIADGSAAQVVPALYHRLAGVKIRMPTMAERREDVPLLFAHFATRAADRHRRALPPLAEAAHRAARQAWPGNVRELEMAADRFVLGIDGGEADAPDKPRLQDRIDAFERAAILEAIADARGEIGVAIAALGLPRKTFYYRVKRLAIDLPAIRKASS